MSASRWSRLAAIVASVGVVVWVGVALVDRSGAAVNEGDVMMWGTEPIVIPRCFALDSVADRRIKLVPDGSCTNVPSIEARVHIWRGLTEGHVEAYFSGEPCPDCRRGFETYERYRDTLAGADFACYRSTWRSGRIEFVRSTCASKAGVIGRAVCTRQVCPAAIAARDSILAALVVRRRAP